MAKPKPVADQQALSWHSIAMNKVLASLQTAPRGLSREEAGERLTRYGPNELIEKHKVKPWQIFLEQFKSFLVIILLVAVGLSAALGEVTDAITILAIVFFAAGLGFVQEYRAEKAMASLKRMAAPKATVIRDGEEMEVEAKTLVPGDIVVLHTGDQVPADARLTEAANLKLAEAALTGESNPVDKTTESLAEGISIGDRRNMVYMGTAVVYGRGTAVVTATGMNTEFGKIATLLQTVKEEKTPLQINLDKMGRWIAIGALALCFALVAVGVARGNPVLDMFIWGVSLAVAAVPEALPAVVVISLALGVRRMVKRNALIRRLPAVETLGCTTIICSDKTGTLTQDQMTVRSIFTGGKSLEVTGIGYEPKGSFLLDGKPYEASQDEHLKNLLRIGSLCNDSRLVFANNRWGIRGDPTEGALVVLAAKAGIKTDEENLLHPRTSEIPFSSETKMMTTVNKTPEGQVAYSKGAPEVILEHSRYIEEDGHRKELTASHRQEIIARSQSMAGNGLRVLGLAYKPLSAPEEGLFDRELVFAGLVGMIDPPRDEVEAAIKTCESAGIDSVMITGDHKLTAVAIARELGILKTGKALTGTELDAMSDEEFDRIVEDVEVYARVSPAHKLRVVEALTRRGHVVAMTGDGVNDAPALKKADIGVAMGITGTDVSKEAAAMVLTDDNFASIVAAVEEGRGIFDNIKKYLMYLLSSNLGEILVMAIGILFGGFLGTGGALPLVAIQILWVNLATDGLPALALAVDPAAPDIMQRKPRPRNQTIFTRPVVALMVLGGVWSAVVNLGIFSWALGTGKSLIEAQCLVFMTLIIIQFFKAFSYRSDRLSLRQIGPFKNRWLVAAVAASLAMTIPLLYVPAASEAFHTYPLDIADWGIVILASSSVLGVLELAKAVICRLETRRKAAAEI